MIASRKKVIMNNKTTKIQGGHMERKQLMKDNAKQLNRKKINSQNLYKIFGHKLKK